MKPIAILPVSLCLFLSVFISLKGHSQSPQIFTSSGSFTPAAGITTVTAEAWGAGGGGSTRTSSGDGGGGGGGGAYARSNNISVTQELSYPIVVGIGGAANSPGGASSFNTVTVIAVGGNGAANNSTTGASGGLALNSTGTTKYSGGNGGNGDYQWVLWLWDYYYSGGGGGGGGSTAHGTNASGESSGNGGTTNGGDGAAGVRNTNTGNVGGNYGGGGSGGVNRAGGNGANGLVRLTYTCPTYNLTSTAITSSPICSGATATVTLKNTNTARLPRGTYTVTYNLTGANTATGVIRTMTVSSAGTGTFTTNTLTGIGTTTITITKLQSGSGTGCSSDITSAVTTRTATVTVTAIPTITNTTPNSRCGTGTVTLGATTLAGTINWYENVTDGIPLGTGPSFTTPSISLTTTYWVDVTNGSCTTATRTAVIATVNNLPTITGTTPAAPICGSGTVTLGATASAGTINWYSAASGGTSLGTGISFTTPSISSTTTYWVDATNGSCTSANRTAVIATVNTIPNAPTVGSITQPDCDHSTGSVVLNNLPTGTWTLTRSPGGIETTGSGTSTTITGLNTGTYKYTVEVADCTSPISSEIVISHQPNCWTGGHNSDWNNPLNWVTGVVPTPGIEATLNTIIHSESTNYPVISNGDSGYIKNMILENNAHITVIDNSLRITESLKLDGKIDLEGESQLLQDLGSTLDPTSSGTIEIDQQGTQDLYTYNYWSSPVVNNTLANSYTVAGVLRDGTYETPREINFINSGHDGSPGSSGTPIGISHYWIHKYANLPSNTYSAWQRIRSTGILLAGEGFTMKGVANTNNNVALEQNYVFVGKPNNGDITLPITAGNDYLVGNPYPSALDADEFILDHIADGGRAFQNIINGALYFWDHFGGGSHLLADYQGGYATYTLIGGAVAISNDARINATGISGTKEPTQYIPVAQGFFVSSILDESLIQDELVSPVVGGTITFKNSQRVFKTESSGASQFMKSSNTKAKATVSKQVDSRQKIRLMFNSPKGYHRQLLVGVDARASNGFDLGFDAPLIETNKEDMFWIFKNNEFVIQAVDNFNADQILPLGIKINQAGISKIKIDGLENINDLDIYLNDKELGIYHPINESPYEVYLEPGAYLNRFDITFKSSGTLDVEDLIAPENIQVYFSNDTKSIIVHNPVLNEIKSVELVNILGQSIQKFNDSTNKDYIEYKTNQISTGVYVIKIQTPEGSFSKKILIK